MQTQAATQSPCFQDKADETLEEVQDALDILGTMLASDTDDLPTDALARLVSRAMGKVIQARADVAATRH